VKRRCAYARRVAVHLESAEREFVTRWYCTLVKGWCPYRAQGRSCPHLSSHVRRILSLSA